MSIKGPKRGCWRDYSAGSSGGLFDIIAIRLCDLPEATADFPRVLEAAADYAGFSPLGETPQTRKARKKRKQERDSRAREEEQRKAQEDAMLVLALRGLAEPVAGSPAETYLVRRHIPVWPETGLAYLPPLDSALPEPLRQKVYSPEYPALVVWARDADGTITGGQRILLDDAGQAAKTDPAKPSFGGLRGCPARFPARDDEGVGPLVIAEGPETALTLWLATGYETRAVFGVSGWTSAPLPTNREIILAPDRDARESPAGKAFRKAVAHHLERGCTLRIAHAPEPEGSRKDLNDTAMEQGMDAVLAAFGAAHPPGPDDLPDNETGATGAKPSTTAGDGIKKRGETANRETEDTDERSADQSDPGGTA